MEWLLQSAGGLKMKHLPTPGGGPAMTAVLGNHAQLWCSPPGVASAHIKSGKVRALAVTGATRQPFLPDVPTLKELGHDVDYYLWVGMFAPKGTPPAAVKTLREALKQAVDDAQFKSAMEKIQTPIAYKDGDDFRSWWDTDAARLGEVIKRIGRIETK
jgi:tripartite-type tricarboxylate transporter receptor subunit TctC